MEEEKIKIVAEMPGNHHYPIRPSDIKLQPHGAVRGGLGKAEIEQAAGNLVIFCQQRGGWYSFTFDELSAFYKRIGKDPKHMFYGLLGPWEDDSLMMERVYISPPFLVVGYNGMLYFTELFIKSCVGKW